MAGRIAGRGGAEHLLSESLAGTGPVLGRYDGGEVTTANVAEKPLGCRVHPPDDSRCVHNVARDTDALQSLLDVSRRLPGQWPSREVWLIGAELQAAADEWTQSCPIGRGEATARWKGQAITVIASHTEGK